MGFDGGSQASGGKKKGNALFAAMQSKMKIETKKPLFGGKLMASLANAMVKPEVKILVKKKVVPHTCLKRLFPVGTEDLIDYRVEDTTPGTSVAEIRKKFEDMDKLLVKTAAGKDFVL